MTVIQENIKAIRKIYGWTCDDLGDLIGVSGQSVCKWETGSREMPTPINYAIMYQMEHHMDDLDEKNAQLAKAAMREKIFIYEKPGCRSSWLKHTKIRSQILH